MTDPERVGLDCDVLGELRKDRDIPAREGLALGLGNFRAEGAETIVLDWYETEREQPVREILLEHMAGKSATTDYALAVSDAFRNSPPRQSTPKPATCGRKRKFALLTASKNCCR